MLKKLVDLIQGLIDKKFYGKLTISFEAGNIVNIKKEESIKIEH